MSEDLSDELLALILSQTDEPDGLPLLPFMQPELPPLLSACRHGEIEEAKMILESGASIEEKGENGWNGLIHACNNGHTDLAAFLISNGASVHARDNKEWTPLLFACQSGHSKTADLLLSKGAAIDARGLMEVTGLMLACRNGHKETVEILLDRGADIHSVDVQGFTPLFFACQSGHTDIGKLLLDRGADIEAMDINGSTVLTIAVQNDRLRTVEMLLDRGANVASMSSNGWNALMNACDKGLSEVVAMLLSRGADIEAVDYKFWTPLMFCCQRDRVETATLLLLKGAKIEARNEFDATPLFIASQCGSYSVASLLISQGADLNAVSSQGDSCLLIACLRGHTRVASLLISKGAAINQKNLKGFSPLMIACQEGYLDIVRKLMIHGADPYDTHLGGASSLDIALNIGHEELARILLDGPTSSSSSSSFDPLVDSGPNEPPSFSLEEEDEEGMEMDVTLNLNYLREKDPEELANHELGLLLEQVGFSRAIQQSFTNELVNGKLLKVLDHKTLKEDLQINDFCDRKRLLYLFSRLLKEDDLSWFIDSISAFNLSHSSSSKHHILLSASNCNVEKIETIITMDDDRFGETIRWNENRVAKWITESNSIKQLESKLIPLHLTGLILCTSTEEELSQFIVPQLERSLHFKVFFTELQSIRPSAVPNMESKKFSLKKYLEDFETSVSCELLLNNAKDHLNIRHFDSMFADLKRAVRDVVGRSNPHDLSVSQIFAIVAYTFENKYAPGHSIYQRLSECLRNQNPQNSKGKIDQVRAELLHWKGFLFHLMSGLKKLPLKSGTVYRGVGCNSREEAIQIASNYEEGTTIEWFGFSSTSTDRNVPIDFIRRNGSGFGVLFEIKVKYGRDVHSYSIYQSEQELLMLPNTSLMVTQGHSFYNPDPIICISMLEIDNRKVVYF